MERIHDEFGNATPRAEGSGTAARREDGRGPVGSQRVGRLRPRSGRVRRGLVAAAGPILFAAGGLFLPPGRGGDLLAAAPARSTLVQAGRTVAQDQGAWVIDYRFRHTGPTGIIVAPEEIVVKVEGWVSNSRVASHAFPRWSSLAVARGPEFEAIGEVIASVAEAHRCREKLLVSVGGEEPDSCRPPSGAKSQRVAGSRRGSDHGPGPAGARAGLPLSLLPGGIVHVRIRLEHQHVLYGAYDPLLGIRAVTMTLGGATVRDLVPLDCEQYLAQPKFTWPEPPKERRDTRHAVTGPDSLHLESHVPGHHYYRFPDRPVRYGTKMRLRFWYLIAAGTEGECSVRIAQYKYTPTSWRTLQSGGFEKCLKVVGRWTKVEQVFTTEPEATTLALAFRIAGDTDVGEMWIDDVSLEPVGCPGHAGP